VLGDTHPQPALAHAEERGAPALPFPRGVGPAGTRRIYGRHRRRKHNGDLVAALREHIAQEEKERRHNPEAWLATLTATTQQQWALLECICTERETRSVQAHAALCHADNREPELEAPPPTSDVRASHGTSAGMPAHGVRQAAARSSRVRVQKATHSPRYAREDRLEALEASLRLLHTKVDAILVHLARPVKEAEPAQEQPGTTHALRQYSDALWCTRRDSPGWRSKSVRM
jgi:hypothetical protein